MIAKILREWSRNLWKYFLPQIESGNPFYLAVDAGVLLETCPKSIEAPKLSNIEHLFYSYCATAYDRHGRYLTLSKFALKSENGEKSLAICLAAQQVAVVSRMVEDHMFSRDEYFPRLREALNLPLHNSNPLRSQEEFFTIWKVLAEEISSCAGYHVQSITFKEGTGRKDRSRALPLSQALLSQHDLATLHSLWSLSLERIDSSSVIKFLDQARLKLTRRGQRLCMLQWQRANVIKQFLEYIRILSNSNIEIKKIQNFTISENAGDLVVFCYEYGLEEKFLVRLIIGAAKQVSGIELTNYIAKRLNSKKYIFFEDDGIKFTDLAVAREIGPKESFIILCERSLVNILVSEILIRGASKICFEQIDCDFSDKYVLLLCRSGLGITLPIDFCYGTLSFPLVAKYPLEVKGGIVIDGRNNTFLADYPPDQICYNNYPLSSTQRIYLNNIECLVEEAFIKFNEVEDFEVFEIKYEQSTVIFRISHGREPLSDSKQPGFRWLSPGHIFPVCEKIEANSIGLISFKFREMGYEGASNTIEPLPPEPLLYFVKLPPKSWLPVTENQASTIHQKIQASSIPRAFKELISHRLMIFKKAPIQVLKLIHSS